MSNKQLRDRFDAIWNALKGMRAGEIQQNIEMSRQTAEQIIGIGEIDSIRNVSLLKLLVYQLIIFADQKIQQQDPRTTKRSTQSSSVESNPDYVVVSAKELRELISNIEKQNSGMNEYTLDKFEFKTLKRKIIALEQQIAGGFSKKKLQTTSGEDLEGTEAMIQQLELLLKKKQKRIRQLNSELENNFSDKEELEMEIDALEERNAELQDTIRMLEQENISTKEELEAYKAQQKEDLLFGASEFMNGGFPHKQSELGKNEDMTYHQQQKGRCQRQLLSSTKVLAKYCNNTSSRQQTLAQTPQKAVEAQQRTVKKAISRVIEEHYNGEEENLLESMRIYPKKSIKFDCLENDEHSLQRMLLIQAAFIQRAMDSFIN